MTHENSAFLLGNPDGAIEALRDAGVRVGEHENRAGRLDRTAKRRPARRGEIVLRFDPIREVRHGAESEGDGASTAAEFDTGRRHPWAEDRVM